MLYCMMVETQYLESDDSLGYYDEEMIPRQSVLILLRESSFEEGDFQIVRANEKRVFESAVVTIRTFTTDITPLEIIKHFRCPVTHWDDFQSWMNR